MKRLDETKKGKSECAVTVDWASVRIVRKRKEETRLWSVMLFGCSRSRGIDEERSAQMKLKT